MKLLRTCVRHSHSRTPEYRAWQGMIRRCENRSCKWYHRYGGRGIVVCQRWRESFVNFLQDIGNRPSAVHSLDRIDNDGNYEPGNCRWVTRREQTLNSSVPRMISFNGMTRSVSDWARSLGIKIPTLEKRLLSGWSLEEALLTPVRKELSRARK